MPMFKPKSTDFVPKVVNGKQKQLLKLDAFNSFGTPLLGLGDITQRAMTTDAIAAVFDLQGFTNFCKQIEPQLAVPVFLNEFLAWLFDQIREEMAQEKTDEGVVLYCPLPFFVKFMGDGLLVLWDASATSEVGRRNIIVSCSIICKNYAAKFFKKISNKVVDAPPVLRCGIARGAVYSVGNGNDYVGTCINMAARLQKLPGATFAFNTRGFTLDGDIAKFFKESTLQTRIAIRGIGDSELVSILKAEYEKMRAADKRQFQIIGS